MSGVFAGFGTIAILIGVGILLAHVGIVDATGQRTLSMIAFYVASPALLIVVLADTDVSALFSGNLVATAVSVAAVGATSIGVSIARRADLAETVVAALTSGYVNAGNLGLPIAAYVLDDAALVAPTLLLQLLVLQPLALTALDVAVLPTRPSVPVILSRPIKNPITVGSAIGLALALAEVDLPTAVLDPLELLGGMSVPSMLLAYGVSLRLGPLPGRGVTPTELGVVVALKMVGQPLVAYLVGRAIGLDDEGLLAVTVLAALPTAQNVFVIATRYHRSTLLARDAIFVSTLASVPVIATIAALLA